MIKLKNRKGFTIVELIIVMVIVAILTLMAILIVSNYIEKAEKTKEMSNADIYYTAAVSAIAEEANNPLSIYKTADTNFSNKHNGLDHNSTLYKNIAEAANVPDENLEVYTVKSGEQINDFNYENIYLPTDPSQEQVLDEWSIIIPITSADNSPIDFNGDIYTIPPAPKSGRYVYKNGSYTDTLLSEYKVEKPN